MVNNYKSGRKECFKRNSSVVIPAGNSTFYHNQYSFNAGHVMIHPPILCVGGGMEGGGARGNSVVLLVIL